MRTHMSGLVAEWGVTCTISRYSANVNSAGWRSGASVSIGTEVLWVQPLEGTGDRRSPGILEDTTHVVFQRYGGLDMRAEDKILPTGETYELDVLAVSVKENHREVQAKRVKRT